MTDQQLQRVPSARIIARLMTTGRDQLSRADTVTMVAIEGGVPTLLEARTLLDRFHALVRRKAARKLLGWSADVLAAKAGVSETWLYRYEAHRLAAASGSRISVLVATLEAAGV